MQAILMLSKPGIVSAETLAGMAGMFLTAATLPSMVAMAWGTLCIALAACGAAVANSVLERERDRLMPRLAGRSRALELIGTFRATALSVALISLALFFAARNLNILATGLLVIAVAAYLLIYTFWLKGSSPWGVIAGAVPGAMPPVIGSAAVAGSISAPSLFLSAMILVWQLPHFWFLALQYRNEYRQAEIPVLAVTHGEFSTKLLILLCISLLLPVSLGVWFFGFCSGIYATVAIVSWLTFCAACCADLFRLRLFRIGYRASIAYLLVNILAIIVDGYFRTNGNLK